MLIDVIYYLSLTHKRTLYTDNKNQLYISDGQYRDMDEMSVANSNKYYVLKGRAVPEVMLKVIEAKRLVESGKEPSIASAVDRVGLSRSSFYKYKDDIFEFHDTMEGTTINLIAQMDDEPGKLSDVLRVIADRNANILTIHQSLPISGIATISLSIRVLPTTGDIGDMVEELGRITGVHHVKMVAGE